MQENIFALRSYQLGTQEITDLDLKSVKQKYILPDSKRSIEKYSTRMITR